MLEDNDDPTAASPTDGDPMVGQAPEGDGAEEPAEPQPDPLTASVVVVTLSRPDFLRTCLQHLEAQTVAPIETIVVDASPDDVSRRLVKDEFPAVLYLRNPRGAGSTATSRNIGLEPAAGDVIAFLDDDAFASPTWLEELLRPYADPTVGGVGGRARNGIAGEEHMGVDEIGRLRADGTLSGNFAADPGRIIEVDHFLGANMSFRRRALLDIGGIHDGYPGTCLCEETDIALRVRAAGWRLLYTPTSVVDHVAAPYPKGKRFDIRYDYFAHRNHLVLLSRTTGYASPEFRRFIGVGAHRFGSELRRAAKALAQPGHRDPALTARTVAGGTSRAAAIVSGMVVGLGAGQIQRRKDRTP